MKIDFSNNKLSGENKEFFLDIVSAFISTGTFGVSTLNLCGNGFSKEDLENFYCKGRSTPSMVIF